MARRKARRARKSQLVGKVGATIKALRFARCMNQGELAGRLHICQGNLSRLERNQAELSLTQTVKIARVFGMAVETFLEKARTVDPTLVERLEAFANGH